VAYLPDNAEIVLNLEGTADGATGRWFNPVTGESAALAESLERKSALTIHRPPGWADAVLFVATQPRPGRPSP
jgi:hypothetical protein